jgi:hypothetical protein
MDHEQLARVGDGRGFKMLEVESHKDLGALAALMGLHLSSSARYERAYRDLMTYIDEGHDITLEQVLKIGLKYSRDRPSAVRTFLRCLLGS